MDGVEAREAGERLRQIVVTLGVHVGPFSDAMENVRRSMAAFAVGAGEQFRLAVLRLNAVMWRARLEEFHQIGMVRPDGRPRRTGHRHRGTVGWERRHG